MITLAIYILQVALCMIPLTFGLWCCFAPTERVADGSRPFMPGLHREARVTLSRVTGAILALVGIGIGVLVGLNIAG